MPRKPRIDYKSRGESMVKMPEDLVLVTKNEIEKRKRKWTYTAISFEDVSQILTIKVLLKYHTFIIERGPFLHWVNRVISNEIKNILRDNYLKYSRPCIKGCVFNTGGTQCSWTSTGEQCEECPLYKKWMNTKVEQHNINQPLALENHSAELEDLSFQSIGEDIDMEEFNALMKLKLSDYDYNMYKKIFLDKNREDIKEDTIKSYGITYQAFSRLKEHLISTAKKIIKEEF